MLIVLIASGIWLPLHIPSAHAAVTLPAGIVSDTPITITNSQPVATSTAFQQMVIINSASFSSSEAANLQNIEFFYADGALIPSWLESGNSNSATNTVYWLRLQDGLPASSTTTVYMGFADPNANLFDGVTVGEASNLSPTHGQYDNGANIFKFYDNFPGTTLSNHWDDFGSNGVLGDSSEITVNNQLTLNPITGTFYQNGVWVATSTGSATLAGALTADAYIAAAQPVTNFARSACQLGCFETRFGFEDTQPNNLNEGNGLGVDIAQPSVLTISNSQYNQVFVTLPTTTLNQFNVYTVNYQGSSASFELNYGDLAGTITSDVPPPSSQMGLFLETNYQQISSNIGWVRTRASPPNGQMPCTQNCGTGGGSSGATVSNAVVNNFQNSLTLPAGAQLYLYGMVTGGGFPSSDFVNGPVSPLDDADGLLIAELGVTTSNTNSYTTQTSFPAIGGIGISGFSTYSLSFGSNNSPAAPSASDTFTVNTAGSLVVVLALAGGEQSLSLSGLSGFTTDATNFNGSCNQGIPPVILIGHAYPSTGQYTVTEQTTQCAAGQDPNHAGDLIGVFIFSPGSASGPTYSIGAPTTNTSPQMGIPYTIGIPITNHDSVDHTYEVGLTQSDAKFGTIALIGNGAVGVDFTQGALALGLSLAGPAASFLATCLGFSQWDTNPTSNGFALPLQLGSPSDIVPAQSVSVPAGQTRVVPFTVTNNWGWIPPWDAKTVVCMLVFGALMSKQLAGFTIKTFLSSQAFLSGLAAAQLAVPGLSYDFGVKVDGLAQSPFSEQVTVPTSKTASWLISVAASAAPSVELTIAAILAAPEACPTLVGCFFVAVGVAGEILMIKDVHDYYISALDPSNDFAQVYIPEPLTLTNGTLFSALPAFTSLGSDFNTFLNNGLSFDLYSNATATSMIRYFGALQSGDNQSARIQLEAAAGYAKLRDTAWQAFTKSVIHLLSTSGTASVNLLDFNAIQIDRAQSMISQSGLPIAETQILEGLGFGGEVSSISRSIIFFNSTILAPTSISTDMNDGTDFLLNQTLALESGISLQGPGVSEIYRDTNGNPLPLDNNGNSRLDAVVASGKVTSTNPGQIVLWTNATNSGSTSVQSLTLNLSMPIDWAVSPTWGPSRGGIHVYFQLSNRTLIDITGNALVTVSTGNPETVLVSIAALNQTSSGQLLAPGTSLLTALKLSYFLRGTTQSVTGYPRTYLSISTVSMWSQPSFSGKQDFSAGSAIFLAYAKVLGDANGDGVVNILDLALVAYSWNTHPGDALWNPATDVLGLGAIDIRDLAYVAYNYGNHA